MKRVITTLIIHTITGSSYTKYPFPPPYLAVMLQWKVKLKRIQRGITTHVFKSLKEKEEKKVNRMRGFIAVNTRPTGKESLPRHWLMLPLS